MEAKSAKSWLAGVYDRAAPTYDRVGESYHEKFGRRLVERAGSLEGASVLDVACGKGAVMGPAAEGVGSGLVVGIDISPEMVRLAEAEMDRLGHAECRTLVMDAETLAFGDEVFDRVFCAFGIHLLPDPDRAAAGFARVLKSGGVLGVSSWSDTDPGWAWEDELIGTLDVERSLSSQPFDTADSLSDLFARAGFRNVRVESEGLDVVFADEEEWWAWKWSYSLRGLLEQLEPDALESFRSEAFARLKALEGAEGYHIRLTSNLVFGTR